MDGQSQAAKNKHIIFNDSDEDDSPVTDGNYANHGDVDKGTRRNVSFDNADHRSCEFGRSHAEKFRFKSSDAPKSFDSSDKKRKHIVFEEQSDSASDSDSETSISEGDFEDVDETSESDHEEEERSAGEYSAMTMEDLLKLQEEMGTKAFKEKVLKVKETDVPKPNRQRPVARLNKNRPSEMPLMRKRAPRMNFMVPGKITKKKIFRDPRFDDLSGSLRMDIWDDKYQFLKETRKKEMEILRNELQEETIPHKKEKIKQTLQRMQNQLRESVRHQQELKVSRLEKQQQREALRRGEKPKYMQNKEKKLLLKTMHFDELKKNNKVNKYLERKEKKQVRREKQHTLASAVD